MFFWHLGATIAFVRYAFRDQAMDLRFLALGALLPDLIDTPIGFLFWAEWSTPRLMLHSITFGSVLLVAVLIFTRRGRRRKQWILVATGVLMHLALDAMWGAPETLWWPFFGGGFSGSGMVTVGAYVTEVLKNPVLWAGEIAGLVYLIALGKRSDLANPLTRSALYRSGTVSASID